MTIRISKQRTLTVHMDNATLLLLEQARHHIGLDKSTFVRQSIREKATAVIAKHQQTRFNAEEWRYFFELLDNPPEPTERMKKGLYRYREIVGNDI